MLSDKQKRAMRMITNAIECDIHCDYAYCETGMYKPFNTNTLFSLERKGLVTLEYKMKGVYLVRLTERD